MVTLAIATPKDFRYKAVVESHGWNHLAPFVYDRETGILTRKHTLSDGTVVTMTLYGGKDETIFVDVTGGRQIITSRQRNEMLQVAKRIFNVAWDLRAFYDTMSKTEGYEWVTEHKAARLLASPTVWEDMAKTLLTTNISWSSTVTMTEKLAAIDPANTFPTPQQVAALSEDELDEQVGAGYRTAYLHNLATRIASGELNVEAWRTLSSDDLYNEIMELTGFGDYAAGTVLRLLGHFDKLAIDSVARNAYEAVVGNEPESDTDIRDYYEDFGEWRGLVLWMDCIRDQYVTVA